MAFSTKPCLIYNVHCCNSKKELKANQVNGRHSDRNPHCKYIHCKKYILSMRPSFHSTVISLYFLHWKTTYSKKMYFFRIQQKWHLNKCYFKHEKRPQKLLIIGPNLFFHYCQPPQNQLKSHFLFHRNVSLLNFYIMTLGFGVIKGY